MNSQDAHSTFSPETSINQYQIIQSTNEMYLFRRLILLITLCVPSAFASFGTCEFFGSNTLSLVDPKFRQHASALDAGVKSQQPHPCLNLLGPDLKTSTAFPWMCFTENGCITQYSCARLFEEVDCGAGMIVDQHLENKYIPVVGNGKGTCFPAPKGFKTGLYRSVLFYPGECGKF
jgi:hypothetical protein